MAKNEKTNDHFSNGLMNTPHRICLIVITLLGVFLRFYHSGELFVFADEIHSLECAVSKSFFWIATHFTSNDSCIPLTLYNKCLLETVGLTEFNMRLPALVAGSLFIIFFAYFTGRWMTPACSILSTGIVSLSPYFVYLSREARPYSIIVLLFNLAFFFMFSWSRNPEKKKYLYGAMICSSVCIYFHPVVAPSTIAILAYPMVLFLMKDIDRKWITPYIISLMFFTGISLLLVGPAVPSLMQGVSSKESLGMADLYTIQHSLMLVLSLPVILPIWLWGLAGIIGGFFLSRLFFKETIWFACLCGIQMAALFVMQPELQEIPWVFFRYIVHIIPFFIIMCVFGVVSLFDKIAYPAPLRRCGIFICCIVVCLFFLYHYTSHHYRINGKDRFKSHPMMIFLPDSVELNKIKNSVSPFYSNGINSLKEGTIAEAPLLVTFPLYGLYQLWHDRNIVTTPMGNGFAQTIFRSQNGLKFKTLISQEKIIDKSAGVRYLVVHKRIKEELAFVFNELKKDKLMAIQTKGMAYLFEDRLLNILFGNGELKSDSDKLANLTPFYEDYYIAVYDMKFKE